MSASPLHVETLGDAGRPPIILVHGFGASSHSWRKWAPELARDHHVILVDLMGFGQAATPARGDYSPVAQAGHLADVIRALRGPVAPVLVGHSLGGAVVLLAALQLQDEVRAGHRDGERDGDRDGGQAGDQAGRDAEAVRGIVVVSGAVFPQPFPPYISLARRAGLGEVLLMAQPPAWALRAGLRGIVHDPETVDDEQVEGYRAPLASSERRKAILQAARQILPASGEDLSDRYREIRAPLLALWGAEDGVVSPAFARRLAETVERGRSVLLPNVGHLPPEEAPEVSLAELRRFLSELDGPFPAPE